MVTHFFHFAGLLTVPFRRQPRIFDRLLRVLEGVEGVLPLLPGLCW